VLGHELVGDRLARALVTPSLTIFQYRPGERVRLPLGLRLVLDEDLSATQALPTGLPGPSGSAAG